VTGIHVVLIDDDVLMLRILEPELPALPTRVPVAAVETAQSPDKGISLVRDAPPGPLLVLCDFNLKAPLNGLDVLREAARLRPDSVRVLISGYAADQIGDVQAGGAIHGFVEKPMRVRDMFPAIAALVNARLS